MCTAAFYKTNSAYFGRTLDYEFSYGDDVTLTPRNFPLPFREMGTLQSHYAILGMAHVSGGHPLYYDAMNEKGLGMAGLNFVGNACYRESTPGKDNIAQFEFIPWILAQCATVREARALLSRVNITPTPFSPQLPVAQLHWIIADREEAVTVEAMKDGLRVYDNPAGVLTNNPPFDEQMFHLNNYMHLSPRSPENSFSDKLKLRCYSRGMGGMGLPGDLSSQSRFVRVAFTALNSRSEGTEESDVSQFFHILGSVDQTRGCCELEDGKYEITIYTSCCSLDKGIYYYTAYDNHGITAVDMHRENLDGKALVCWPLRQKGEIRWEN